MANVYRFYQVHKIYISPESILNCMVYLKYTGIPWITVEFSDGSQNLVLIFLYFLEYFS